MRVVDVADGVSVVVEDGSPSVIFCIVSAYLTTISAISTWIFRRLCRLISRRCFLSFQDLNTAAGTAPGLARCIR